MSKQHSLSSHEEQAIQNAEKKLVADAVAWVGKETYKALSKPQQNLLQILVEDGHHVKKVDAAFMLDTTVAGITRAATGLSARNIAFNDMMGFVSLHKRS